MRDRLIELLNKQVGMTLPVWMAPQTIEILADGLLENGVIVPPFKLGQEVWYTGRPKRKQNIFSVKVIYITHTDVGFIISVENEYGHRFEMDAEALYITKEEAEQALKGGVE